MIVQNSTGPPIKKHALKISITIYYYNLFCKSNVARIITTKL